MSKSTDILAASVRCIEAAEKHQQKLALEWKRMYEVYLGIPDGKKRRRKRAEWRSEAFVKHAFQQVETLLPEFLVEDPNFEVVGREQSDEPRAKTVQKLLDYQLDRDRYAEKRMAAVKKAIIFGACPIKVTWAYERKSMKVRNPMSAEERLVAMSRGEEVPAFITQEVTLRDDPTMIVVDPFDFMWDPAATSIDDAAYVLHRSWLTTDQLKAKEKAGIYEGVSKALDGKSASGGGGVFDSVKRLFGEDEEQSQAKRGDRHEVIEKWSRDRLVVILNRQAVVRDVENPYWHNQIPFAMVITQPDIDKMTGLSEVWSLEALQESANMILRGTQDALALTVDPPLALRSNDPRLKEISFEPGLRVFLDDPSSVRTIDIGQANAYATGGEVDRLVGWMERTTGINASISGGSNESTATEAAMNLRQGKGRIALKVSHVDRAFARAAEQFIQLDQQFIDADRVLRIVGDGAEWETVTPQDIAGAFDVRPRNSTDRTLKELAREQSLNLLNTFAQYAGMGVNIWPLINKAAEAHEIKPEELQPVAPPQPAPAVDPATGQPAPPEPAVTVDGLDANGFAPDALTGA